MTIHFEQGEYQIKQDGKDVGWLVALDADASNPAVEYFFLYQNIPATHATYKTYTAPAESDREAATDKFGLAKDTEWEIVPQPTALDRSKVNTSTYHGDLESRLKKYVVPGPATTSRGSS